jgi:diguanylate cyclase (GGDEF)-like protein
VTAYFRRDLLRSLRLILVFVLLVVSVSALVQARLAHASAATMLICAGVLSEIVLLRVLEFRRDRLVPFVVDLVELAGIGLMQFEVHAVDPVLGPLFFLVFFRAATGSLRRLLPYLAGAIAVGVGVSLGVGIPVIPGPFLAMPVLGPLIYGMRMLLLRLQDQHREQSAMLGDVLSRLPFPVVVAGEDGSIRLANPAAADLTGPIDELRAHRDDGTPVDLRLLPAGESGLELCLTRPDGTQSQVLVDTVPTEHGTIVALLDVTAQRGYEEQLQYAAFHDALTGLPNRALLWRRFAAAADDAYAILLIDMDGFKAVNDTLGHLAGDELLCGMAQRIRQVVGRDATLARLGGDEFAVLLPHAGVDRAEAVVAAVYSCFNWDFPLSTGPIRAGASVGYAVGEPGRSPDEVLAAADAAMYERKRGRAQVPAGL